MRIRVRGIDRQGMAKAFLCRLVQAAEPEILGEGRQLGRRAQRAA